MKTTMIDATGRARCPQRAAFGKAALVAAALCVATATSPSFADTVTADAALAAAKGWVNLR